jgi:riboflavin synthase
VFTGIVEEIGTVAVADRVADDHLRVQIDCQLVVSDADLGDSIAVNGCCLTVTSLAEGGGFTADLMDETLAATSLGDLTVGQRVNLERAMQLGDRLGGHLVQGHVDATGEVVERVEQPGTTFLRFTAPPQVARYLVPNGSITIDGTSLTVVDVQDDEDGAATFRVGLIPHTLDVTTWGAIAVGDRVNLEADAMAKYADRLLAGGASSVYSPSP